MASFVRIDDGVIRNLLLTTTLHAELPGLAPLKRELDNIPKQKGCRCRRSKNPGANVIAKTKAYIQALPADKKAVLKRFLKADYIQMMVTDAAGRHKDFTW